ncbi:pirin-like protein [Nitzschia inconspicua]|uniref:Pirin-like protein n=1 Tax=Nitzschia inconspicua TaxID=303405 RepID=A0A9K3Q3G8_9STRA|nr:pirin-like protein [Nitzschia inconspicua]
MVVMTMTMMLWRLFLFLHVATTTSNILVGVDAWTISTSSISTTDQSVSSWKQQRRRLAFNAGSIVHWRKHNIKSPSICHHQHSLQQLQLRSSYYGDNDDDDDDDTNDSGSDNINNNNKYEESVIRWKVSPPPPPSSTSRRETILENANYESTKSTTTSTTTVSPSSSMASPKVTATKSPPQQTTTTSSSNGITSSLSTNNGTVNSQNIMFRAPRQIRVERYARLPVWPVWSGVLLFIIGLLVGQETASKLEYWMGGRVCPMILHQDDTTTTTNSRSVHSTTTTTTTTTSPFLLLVHHNHRFPWWDGIGRTLTKQFLPEGFPSHPHRGFTTMTYVLQGGFVHRDSMGIKQEYGDNIIANGNNKNNNNKNYLYSPVQWLFTGAGLLHEEMFSPHQERQELYQLWINVPAEYKLAPPQVKLLSTTRSNSINTNTNEESNTAVVDMPVITQSTTSHTVVDATIPADSDNNNNNHQIRQQPALTITTKSTVRIVAGKYEHRQSTAPIMSDMAILHVTVKTFRNRRTERKLVSNNISSSTEEEQEQVATSTVGWTYTIPPHFDTLLLYIRQGSCDVTTTCTSQDRRTGRIGTRTVTKPNVRMHSTVFVQPSIEFRGNCKLIQESITITPSRLGDTVDVLVLTGQPLYERFVNGNINNNNIKMSSSSSSSERTSSTVEPISMQGSMVMNFPHEIETAYVDYRMGKMGRPWDHELTDDEWKRHVERYPNIYYRSQKNQNKESKYYDNNYY